MDRIRWCDVMLVIIGEHWIGYEKGKSGRWVRRLDSASDYIRFEIETGFSLGKTIIPVLVGNAAMPTAEELPASLKQLAYLQTREVRVGPDYDRWISRLTQEIIAMWRGGRQS